jgi:hypothetical protein
MHMTMDAKNSKQVNFIGRAQLTPVVPLPDGLGESGLLVALGNMHKSKTAPLLGEIERPRVEASLESFDFLVASTHSNLEDLLSASMRLAKLHPGLKVVLVDSQEAPLLEDDELPQGVESVVQVTEEQAEAGRGLLFQQASILAGQNAGRAAYVAFIMEAKIETGARIAVATTNLTPRLLGVD